MARLFAAGWGGRGETVALGEAEHRHLCRVLRLGPGDRVTLFDGRGREAEAEIVESGAHRVTLRLGESREIPVPPSPAVTLVVGLTRGERLEWVVQKATELGVAAIQPVSCARSVERLDGERARSRVERWRRIAAEAARQCGRAAVPQIEAPRALAEALGAIPERALRLVLWEELRGEGLRRHLPVDVPREIAVLVGPEGGLTDEEVALAGARGFLAVGLGPRTLRAETAALAALAVLGYALGDLG